MRQEVFERISFHARQALSKAALDRCVDDESFYEHTAMALVSQLEAKLFGQRNKTKRRVGYSGISDILAERVREAAKAELEELHEQLDEAYRNLELPESVGVEVTTEEIKILDPRTLEEIPDSAQVYAKIAEDDDGDDVGWIR